MILRILQIAAFIFTATIEVKVHAVEVLSLKVDKEPIQEPTNCLESGDRCALKTAEGKKYLLELGSAVVTLGSATSVIRSSTDRLMFVTGTLLLKSKEPFFVESEFGKIVLNNAEVIVQRDAKRLQVSVIKGEAFIHPRGKEEMFKVEPGQRNWVGEVDTSGVAQTGTSTPVEFQDHAFQWSSLYSGKKNDFKKELKEFAAAWQKASEVAASKHKELAQRRIASLEKEHQIRQARLQKKRAYEAQLRSMFRRKSLDQ